MGVHLTGTTDSHSQVWRTSSHSVSTEPVLGDFGPSLTYYVNHTCQPPFTECLPRSKHGDTPLTLCMCEVVAPSPEETRLAGLGQLAWGRTALGSGPGPLPVVPSVCDEQPRGQPRT